MNKDSYAHESATAIGKASKDSRIAENVAGVILLLAAGAAEN